MGYLYSLPPWGYNSAYGRMPFLQSGGTVTNQCDKPCPCVNMGSYGNILGGRFTRLDK